MDGLNNWSVLRWHKPRLWASSSWEGEQDKKKTLENFFCNAIFHERDPNKNMLKGKEIDERRNDTIMNRRILCGESER